MDKEYCEIGREQKEAEKQKAKELKKLRKAAKFSERYQ